VFRPARRRASRPSLTQFVILSMLLHALFILLFGSPTGGSREGRASWGSLDVTIRGPLLVFSPDTTRTPTPWSMAKLPLFTSPSSTIQLSARDSWK